MAKHKKKRGKSKATVVDEAGITIVPDPSIVINEKPTPREYCSECQNKLSRIPWNTSGDLGLCNNLSCNKYRQPQSWFRNGRFSMDEVFSHE
jgi:hypothetical protein